MRNWLLNTRKQKGLTQEEVAKKIGISRNAYAMIERGDRGVTVSNAKKLADLFGFEWTIFFENECHETCKKDKQTS
ncbi:helix-turn-helix transcriptional regulator [Marinococcus halophilus]|uniref:helix-turn-helix transcriptional regulator n=1 Tax=Marinococcus halophilus TaxID=1371 RepID=UPI0009A6158A|nr:helix-turn-helix transcriptional regulator [Marinococcus halophilus]